MPVTYTGDWSDVTVVDADGCTDPELGDLTIEVPGGQPLPQQLDASRI